MIPQIPIETFASIERLCKKYEISELSLFGSRARGDFKYASDFDFLVEFLPGAYVSLITLGNLQIELEAVLHADVDVVPKQGLKQVIKKQVLSEAKIVYAV